MASSSAECSWDKPPFNFVRVQESTMCDNACFSSQGHKSVAAWFHNFLQTPQWPCAVRKRLSRDHCCREKLKPGCRIVGSSTGAKLTTWADLQFSFHWLLMSKDTRSCHKAIKSTHTNGCNFTSVDAHLCRLCWNAARKIAVNVFAGGTDDLWYPEVHVEQEAMTEITVRTTATHHQQTL